MTSDSLREFMNFVRNNQRLHELLLESMSRNERNIFSLIYRQANPGLSNNGQSVF